MSDDKTFDIPVAVFIFKRLDTLRGFSIDLLRFGLVSSISLLTRGEMRQNASLSTK